MPELAPAFLFLHLLGVMVGLGPTFVFSRMMSSAAREPAHIRFTSKLVQSISSGWSHPIAGLVLLSGFGLIWSISYDVLGTPWLLLAIVLFVPSYIYAALVQNRDIGRVLSLTEAGPPDPASPEGQESARRRVRIKRGGVYMRLTALAILALMVFKPALG